MLLVFLLINLLICVALCIFYSQKQISRLLISDVFLAEISLIVLKLQNCYREMASDNLHEDDHIYMPPKHEVRNIL